MPFAIRWEHADPVIDWLHIGARRFVEPFFGQTIQNRMQDADYDSTIRVTPAQFLHDLQDSHPGLPPAGFVFHASRCGSTLVSQMLASVPRHRVLSEPPILSSFLAGARRDSCLPDDAQARLLRGIILVLGRSSHPEEQLYFIKFDSRAILAISLIQRAFPDVPRVFLYREPLEILGAQLRGPGTTLPPGLAQAGLLADDDSTQLDGMPPGEFWTRVLASRYAAAIDAYQPGKALLLNYRQLPDAVWEGVLPFFGAACSPGEMDWMRAVARLNAKDPSRSFVDDSAVKRGAVSPAVRELVDLLVMPHHLRLESLRLGELAGQAKACPTG